MSEETERQVHHHHYPAPPNISEDAWLATVKMQADIENRRLQLYERVIKLVENNIPHYKDYIEKKTAGTLKYTLAFLTGIAILATILAALDKIGGEAIAFLMGTLAGYAISLAAKHLQ